MRAARGLIPENGGATQTADDLLGRAAEIDIDQIDAAIFIEPRCVRHLLRFSAGELDRMRPGGAFEACHPIGLCPYPAIAPLLATISENTKGAPKRCTRLRNGTSEMPVIGASMNGHVETDRARFR